MIVKNEESNLEDCLASVKDLVDEMVVVDTGSEDRTVEIAEAMGANVFHFPWVDSFAAARNVSLEHATGDWIFWMDADDRLDEENRSKLKRLLATLGNDNACFNVKCECLPDPVTKTTTRVDHIRLFRNHPKIRWQYRVHEQILPAIRALNGQVRFSDVVVHHTGYQDPALRKRKLQRDLRLLDLDRKDHPNDPFILFNLGSILLEQGRPDQALEPLQRSLAASNKQDSIVRKLHAMTTGALSAMGRKTEALAACRQGRGDYPQDVELLYKEGKLLWELDRVPEAEATFRKILDSPPEAEHFASVDVGIRGYKSRHYLALISRKQQKLEQAKEFWKLTVQEQPDFLSGWMGLGEIALQQRDQPTLEEVAQKVEGFSAVEAEVLRIRWLLQNQEYVPARQRAEQATQDYPEQIAPREVLSHVLLKQGKDWNAAENALREVLRLDPHHSEAIRNLHVLQQRQPGG